MLTLSSWTWTLRSTMWWDLWIPAPQIPESQCSSVELQVSQQHKSSIFSPLIQTPHLSNHVMHYSSSQIFPSQRASPPGRVMWAVWETWQSITAEWASVKLFWSVERSVSEPVQLRNTSVNTTTIPNTALTKHIKYSLSLKHNNQEKYSVIVFTLWQVFVLVFVFNLLALVYCFTWKCPLPRIRPKCPNLKMESTIRKE